jgi:drug/metabolite transporter (DMT)-like permease
VELSAIAGQSDPEVCVLIAPLTAGLILVAAVAHAVWNALAKTIPARAVVSTWIGVVYLAAGAAGAAIGPVPAAAAWPFLIVSSVVQLGYLLLLAAAYRHGEFGQTYPIARGLSPFVVTVVSVTVLHEHLGTTGLLGICLVCGGLVALASLPTATGARSGRPGGRRVSAGVWFAALTGLTIAGYTLLDGIGVRRSGHPIGYALWLFFLQGVLIVAVAAATSGPALLKPLVESWRTGLVIGALSFASYGLVVWAQARAPLAGVATLRETSVVFAALLGRLVFGERLGVVRVAAAGLVAAGIVAIAVT